MKERGGWKIIGVISTIKICLFSFVCFDETYFIRLAYFFSPFILPLLDIILYDVPKVFPLFFYRYQFIYTNITFYQSLSMGVIQLLKRTRSRRDIAKFNKTKHFLFYYYFQRIISSRR